jgi:ABC-type microcin C transport system permease subunit YejB
MLMLIICISGFFIPATVRPICLVIIFGALSNYTDLFPLKKARINRSGRDI